MGVSTRRLIHGQKALENCGISLAVNSSEFYTLALNPKSRENPGGGAFNPHYFINYLLQHRDHPPGLRCVRPDGFPCGEVQ